MIYENESILDQISNYVVREGVAAKVSMLRKELMSVDNFKVASSKFISYEAFDEMRKNISTSLSKE